MAQGENEFCRSLQADWSVDGVTYRNGVVSLSLSRGDRVPAADPAGREGFAVTSEPHVFREIESAEVRFTSVLWCQLVDEFSFATTGAVADDDPESCVGHQFRCYSRSHLLTALRPARTDQEAARLKHYRLVTDGEVVDVVCADVAEVIVRGSKRL